MAEADLDPANAATMQFENVCERVKQRAERFKAVILSVANKYNLAVISTSGLRLGIGFRRIMLSYFLCLRRSAMKRCRAPSLCR